MGGKYPLLPPREIIKKLAKFGFVFISQKGSHAKYSNGKRICVIPLHDQVQRGTLKGILEQADITFDQFLENE